MRRHTQPCHPDEKRFRSLGNLSRDGVRFSILACECGCGEFVLFNSITGNVLERFTDFVAWFEINSGDYAPDRR